MDKINLKWIKNEVLLAVSGGVDSMVMLDIFIKNFALPMSVVTVNHNLREQAASDCAFVADFCAERGVKCVTVELDVANFARDNRISTETAARILRFKAFDEVAQGRQIALAHHKDDQAETILMHLLRGSGLNGAIGMKAVNGDYIRPLLNYTREEIMLHAEQNGVPYVVDGTNFDTEYKRNFIRHEVMPKLKEFNANAVGNLARFALSAAADDEFIQSIVDVIYNSDGVKMTEFGCVIDQSVLTLHKSLASRAIFRAFSDMGYKFDVEQKHVDDVISLGAKTCGKKLSLPFDLIAVKGYNEITIYKKSFFDQNSLSKESAFRIGKTAFNGYTVVAEKITKAQRVSAEQRQSLYCAKQAITQDEEYLLDRVLRFDLDKVPSGAVYRSRREGDTFTRFGGRSKKLKNYLIDVKIPLQLRDKLVLLCEGSRVLLIVGVEISESVKVDESTDTVMRIYLTKEK